MMRLLALLLAACLGTTHAFAQTAKTTSKPKPPAKKAKSDYKEYAPVKAQLTIKDRDGIVTLWGRTKTLLTMTPDKADTRARTHAKIAAVTETKFLMDIDLSELDKASRKNDWAAVVRILRPAVAPTLPYLDMIENNATDLARNLGDAMLRDAERATRLGKADINSEKNQAKYKAAYTVYRRLSDAHWHPAGKIGAIKRLLCLIRMNKPKTAAHYLEEIEEPYPGDAAYGIYYLVQSELALQKKDYRAAMLATVKSLTFENKDIDTFPDALLISAECYEELQEWHRARDVYFEIAKVFPGTDWAKVARNRLRFVMSKNLTEDEEKLPIENVFFAWQEDMNERVTAFLESDEARLDEAPEVRTPGDTDVDLDKKDDSDGDKDLDLD